LIKASNAKSSRFEGEKKVNLRKREKESVKEEVLKTVRGRKDPIFWFRGEEKSGEKKGGVFSLEKVGIK